MNKCVLRCALKVLMAGIWRTERGSLFQVDGPATEKEREPIVMSCVLEMRKKSVPDDERREQDEVHR